jgi:hypothetical protein
MQISNDMHVRSINSTKERARGATKENEEIYCHFLSCIKCRSPLKEREEKGGKRVWFLF